MINIEALEQHILKSLKDAPDLDSIESIRVEIIGKNGILTQAMKQMAMLTVDEKKQIGQKLNAFRDKFTQLLHEKKLEIEDNLLQSQLQSERLDITLPVISGRKGSLHPITQVISEVTEIFSEMGFKVAEGPDIETDFNNFSALNIPENHPARQMHDTFYLKDLSHDGQALLLRTHTSTVQVHTMLKQNLPIRIIAPGRTYRCDSDQTHTPMFHQVEGLYIDRAENVHMGHLKWCIKTFCQTFFEISTLKVRFRPSFFPFTEPSAEVDIGCNRTKNGIQLGIGHDWLEIMGCGMVHPNVLRNCGIDPEIYQGFAFGMGVERLAMLKYNIPDLRTFFEGHYQWLQHYGFFPFMNNYRSREDLS